MRLSQLGPGQCAHTCQDKTELDHVHYVDSDAWAITSLTITYTYTCLQELHTCVVSLGARERLQPTATCSAPRIYVEAADYYKDIGTFLRTTFLPLFADGLGRTHPTLLCVCAPTKSTTSVVGSLSLSAERSWTGTRHRTCWPLTSGAWCGSGFQKPTRGTSLQRAGICTSARLCCTAWSGHTHSWPSRTRCHAASSCSLHA